MHSKDIRVSPSHEAEAFFLFLRLSDRLHSQRLFLSRQTVVAWTSLRLCCMYDPGLRKCKIVLLRGTLWYFHPWRHACVSFLWVIYEVPKSLAREIIWQADLPPSPPHFSISVALGYQARAFGYICLWVQERGRMKNWEIYRISMFNFRHGGGKK